jgi:AraC-like DNA-binding protein
MNNNFTPLQPGYFLADQQLEYREYKPHTMLANSIYCYWSLRHTGNSAVYYPVACDACTDILISIGGEQPMCIGPSQQAFGFMLQPASEWRGIRILPGRINSLFPFREGEIAASVIPALDSVKDKNFVAEFLCNAVSMDDFCTNANRVFLHLYNHSISTQQERIQRLLHMVYTHQGRLEINRDLCTEFSISPAHLRRLFNEYTGMPPKVMNKIIRFQHALQLMLNNKEDSFFFLDAGYFDQSHFIRDFISFYGFNPSELKKWHERFVQ